MPCGACARELPRRLRTPRRFVLSLCSLGYVATHETVRAHARRPLVDNRFQTNVCNPSRSFGGQTLLCIVSETPSPKQIIKLALSQ